MLSALAFLSLVPFVGPVHAQIAPTAPPFLGDYDAEPRRPDGHVDCAALLKSLQELHANTYMWLMWHKATDWEDLHEFLPLAREAGISVWAYLVPHSETPASNPRWPYSEPFRLDYVRWAREIAKLSLEYRNLVGYVIDDFAHNVRPGRFTPDYITEMVSAGKEINPELRFYPLLYYREINLGLMNTIGPLVDGVVAAYPQSRAEIEEALAYLNDEHKVAAGLEIVYPAGTPSRPGHLGSATQEATVVDAERAQVSFRYQDDYDGPTTGYHVLQVLVDDQVVWQEDAGGFDRGNATVDLREAVAGKQRVKLSFAVYDLKGVSEFGLRTNFSRLEVTGLKLEEPLFAPGEDWQTRTVGAFEVRLFSRDPNVPRYKLPLIIMPAGSRGEYAHRYEDDPTPENIAARVQYSLDLVAAGKAEGVVTYCLDKKPGNPDLKACADAFARHWEQHAPAPAEKH